MSEDVVHVRADLHADRAAHEGLEPRDLERHGVDADPKARETVRAAIAADCRHRLQQDGAGERHGDARHHASARVGDLPVDLSRLLGEAGRGDGQGECRREQEQEPNSHTASFMPDTRVAGEERVRPGRQVSPRLSASVSASFDAHVAEKFGELAAKSIRSAFGIPYRSRVSRTDGRKVAHC